MRSAWKQQILLGLVALAVTATAVVPAKAWAYGYNETDNLHVSVHQAYYLSPGGTITRVAIADPTIADVNVIDGHSLNIVGMATGSTTLNVWTSYGGRQTYNIIVTRDDPALAQTIQQAINLPGVTVKMIGGKALLQGTVKNQRERHLAYTIAHMYLDATNGSSNGTSGNSNSNGTFNRTYSSDDNDDDDNSNGSDGTGSSKMSKRSKVVSAETVDPDSDQQVVNLLEMENPDQINIESLIIEINKNASRQLGLQYGGEDNNTFSFGESYGQQRDAGNHWYNRNWLFTRFSRINAQLRTLISDGKARVISRPNITTMSGQSAEIHVGGNIPYPMRDSVYGGIYVDDKPYGIILKLREPTVDDDGNITSRLYAKVSRLDWSNAVTENGFDVPATIDRSVSTTVNIPSGMTMVIGGLLDSQETKTVSKMPILGDIPLLGELFKYHYKTHDDTEIMVLITPHVVNEETPVPMTDEMKETYEGARRVKDAMNKVKTNADLDDEDAEPVEQEPEKSTENTKPVDKSVDNTTAPGTYHKVDLTQVIRDYEAQQAK